MDSAIGRDLLTESEEFWLRGLAFYDAGSRSYYSTKKPINTPDDLKGLKIRVQNSVTAMNMVKAMGGSPTPIAWGELYTALQQGVVKPLLPLFLTMLVGLMLITFIPQISLFLPKVLGLID